MDQLITPQYLLINYQSGQQISKSIQIQISKLRQTQVQAQRQTPRQQHKRLIKQSSTKQSSNQTTTHTYHQTTPYMDPSSSSSRYSTYLIPTLLLTLLLLLPTPTQCTTYDLHPLFTTRTNTPLSTVTRISPSQDRLMIGYYDGSVLIFDISGNYLHNCTGHTASVIDAEWLEGVGLVTLDAEGRVVRWGEDGGKGWEVEVGAGVVGMVGGRESGGEWVVGVNLGGMVVEYGVRVDGAEVVATYPAPLSQQFTTIHYSPNHTYLYTATSTSEVHQYSCSSPSTPLRTIKTILPGQVFAHLPNSNNITLALQSMQIYNINSDMSFTLDSRLGEYRTKQYISCPQVLVSVVSTNRGDFMLEHSTSLKVTGQFANLFRVEVVDCSAGYVVAADLFGAFTVTSLSRDDQINEVSGVLVYGVSGVGCLVMLACVVVGVFAGLEICRMRKELQEFAKVGAGSTQ